MSALPAGATDASLLRYHIAEELARSCPPELGREIAVTGSVSRGIADQYSDIEIHLWSDELPAREDWWKWLQKVGASDVSPDGATDEELGITWVTFRFRGVWVEAGWQTIPRLDAVLRRLLAAEITAHHRLILASAILHALPLRSESLLAGWQQELSHYPEPLQAQLIKDNTAAWSDPHVPGVRWALVERGQRYPLAMRLVWDVQNLLAVLFASNRVWQPDWKWIEHAAAQLPLRPDRLPQRLDEIFTLAQPEQSVLTAFQLILDTLALVPEQYDVTAAVSSLQQSLSGRLG
jgi:hypothetical protein